MLTFYGDAWDQANVLRWMFFEQYSHEPALAVLRYLKLFSPSLPAPAGRIAELMQKSQAVLDVLNRRLQLTAWIAGPRPTIADYALYPIPSSPTRQVCKSPTGLGYWPGSGVSRACQVCRRCIKMQRSRW